ncbi:MalY/PatB family protein [Polynucleobacter sp.]|uniref:MalY/PatB family protein n=1 Tax=Polynucleobacter sp. TaxID=2029855 RepID=UPI0027329C3D|nr:PatB family C-S lyase [Polynucleobacter sp.]MDP3121967.1 PatB family C-S lyase [Polynucleobacter sp.]
MTFNFDTPVNRSHSDSIRWDRYAGDDVIPLWVADMDFQSPPCVMEALAKRVQDGVFGYTHAPDNLRSSIASYLVEHYHWEVDPDWIVILPSVVSGLYTAVRQLTNPTEHILVPQPVYHHLRLACVEGPRAYTEIPLALEHDRWVLPWQALDQFHQTNTKLALLCNPQNPGGTVYTKSELLQFAEFCEARDILICSDEIHAGLVLDQQNRHVPIASLDQRISMRTVTLMSLNKVFNFPGIGLAWAVAENPRLRAAMQTDLHRTIAEPGLMAYTATMAALRDGEEWRQSLLQYLRGNRDYVAKRIETMSPLTLAKTEASYLAWIDCRALKCADPHALFLSFGLALSPGAQFNAPQFVRLNFGTQRALLAQAMDRMALALASIKR